MHRRAAGESPNPKEKAPTATAAGPKEFQCLIPKLCPPRLQCKTSPPNPRICASTRTRSAILARLRARFRVFEDYARSVVDHAGLELEVGTPFGWYMRCPSGINPRTVRNFPIQSTAAEILHVACILAERRGVAVVAPVHDAIMVEAAADQIDDASTALDRVMRDAAALVLRGYELPTDVQPVRAGGRFFEKRGVEMWDTITRLTAKLEKEAVA